MSGKPWPCRHPERSEGSRTREGICENKILRIAQNDAQRKALSRKALLSPSNRRVFENNLAKGVGHSERHTPRRRRAPPPDPDKPQATAAKRPTRLPIQGAGSMKTSGMAILAMTHKLQASSTRRSRILPRSRRPCAPNQPPSTPQPIRTKRAKPERGRKPLLRYATTG